MPAKVMRDFATELLRRGLNISRYGQFASTKASAGRYAGIRLTGGLVNVMGGLEVASNRLLSMMKKATTVEHVARVAKNFRDAGIRAHSPIGRDPSAYGIELEPLPPNTFLQPMLCHIDPHGADHGRFAHGLTQALAFFVVGQYCDVPSEQWFDFPVPTVSIDRDLIAKVLAAVQVEVQALFVRESLGLRSARKNGRFASDGFWDRTGTTTTPQAAVSCDRRHLGRLRNVGHREAG